MQKELIATQNHCGGASSGGTQAVRAGNLILVGGQMSLDEHDRVVGADIATQARYAFEALKRVPPTRFGQVQKSESPEGFAATLTPVEFLDGIAFLSSLK